MSSPKEFHMDAIYPSKLTVRRGHGLSNSCSESGGSSSPSYRRAVRKQTHRGHSGTGGRFRTQPVTFHEIKEVDEENLAETEPEKKCTAGAASKSESDLKAKFELFYRSIGANSSNNSDKNSSSAPSPKLAPLPLLLSQETESSTTTKANTSPNPSETVNSVKLNKNFMSQDDSSTTTTKPCPINTHLNFNPKSRPSL